jgi:ubiquinone/menaquinone biosynthesis C-methylase UbiE
MRKYFAKILVYDLTKYTNLDNKKILDVGGASGEFSKYIGENFNCQIINLDPEPVNPVWKTVKATADKIPFEDNTFDIVFFRGVLEHIQPKFQQASINEIFRVMKQDSFGYFVIPPWYNFHAGHGLKPFHLLPFPIAKFLRNLFFKKKITHNSYEEASLYKVTHKSTQYKINKAGFSTLATLDTHLRMHFITKIPLIREALVPAVAFIVKK